MRPSKTTHDTFTPLDLLPLPDKQASVAAFKGKTIHELRTPAAVIDRGISERNAERTASETRARGSGFRAHVKTHKTAEASRIQVTAGGGTTRVIASTLPEIHHLVKEGSVEEGSVDDILYGSPIAADKIHDSATLQASTGGKATIRVMVDHPDQVSASQQYSETHGRSDVWNVFIKVDGGGRRAGAPPESDQMKSLITAILNSSAVEIFGFYSHFGQSYSSKDHNAATDYFNAEVACVNTAAKFARSLGATGDWTLSVGATPTTHAATSASVSTEGLCGSLELHAGNYCICDLQQYATSLVDPSNIASTVISRILSVYPDRREGSCDCGGLSVSKDQGPIGGFGDIISPQTATGWYLGGVSQEHGISRRKADRGGLAGLHAEPQNAEKSGFEGLEIGDSIRLVPQHACSVCAGHPWIYVVDGGEEVVDVWVTWKGW